jgi:hypothetical protein
MNYDNKIYNENDIKNNYDLNENNKNFDYNNLKIIINNKKISNESFPIKNKNKNNNIKNISNDNSIIKISSNLSNKSTINEFTYSQTEKQFYKKIGNCYAFFFNEYGDPYLIIGPQYWMFILLTILVNFLIIIFLILNLNNFSLFVNILCLCNLITFQISYTYTFMINPGYPKNDIGRKNGEPKDLFSFCRECKFYVYKNRNVNHCYDCGICVEGYDHHCPWTSKCIGIYNLFSSYVFLVSLIINFIFFVLFVSAFAQNY